MNLIEEIEAAAERHSKWHSPVSEGGDAYNPATFVDNDCDASEVVECEWWPRIRAALLAAQEMDRYIDFIHARDDVYDQCECQRNFREAMNGK